MKRERRSRQRQGQRGAASVEAALVMIPFLALVLTVVNLGLNFFLIDALQDRASMAARFAALDPTNIEGAKNMLLYGYDSVPTEADDIVTPPPAFMDLTESSVSVTRYDAGTPLDRMVLSINGATVPLFVPGLSDSLTVKPITATVPVELP